MIRHGRSLRGIKHHKHKLQPAQVLNIRDEFSSGVAGKNALARRYSVSKRAIHLIVIGKNWAWL